MKLVNFKIREVAALMNEAHFKDAAVWRRKDSKGDVTDCI